VALVAAGSLLPPAMNPACASMAPKVLGNFAWGNCSPRFRTIDL
jgi:hypothetical protein